MAHLPALAQAALLLGALATAGLAITKIGLPTYRWARGLIRRFGGALDTLGGRPPIIDRITGKELAPEVPALGIVLEGMKTELARVANTNERIDRLESRVDTLEGINADRLAEKFETGAKAVLAAVEQTNADVTDV